MPPFIIWALAGIAFVGYCVYKTRQAGEKIRRDIGEWVMNDELEAPKGLMMECPETNAVKTS